MVMFDFFQVGCVPWGKVETNSTRFVEDIAADALGVGPANSTAVDKTGPSMAYALLSCVAGTLTVVPYLRVSSLPKILLLLLLSVTYTAVMESSGYRQAVGLDLPALVLSWFTKLQFYPNNFLNSCKISDSLILCGKNTLLLKDNNSNKSSCDS